MGKIDFDHTTHTLGDLIKYNKRDVEIMVRVEEKKHLIAFYNNVRKLARSQFCDVLQTSSLVDNLMLWYAQKKFKVVLPTRKHVSHAGYKGAYVKEPELGMHEWVAVFDFSSLYPNIMKTFNMSPETVRTEESSTTVKVGEVYFDQSKTGIFPTVCTDFMLARNDIKKKMKTFEVGSESYNNLQAEYDALKSITNSVYGYACFENSRLYSFEVGSSITAIGRALIHFIEQNSGIQILYADTDSVFIKLTAKDLEESLKVCEELSTTIQAAVDEFVKQFGLTAHSFSMQLEKIYRRLYLGGKKRYMGKIWYKGKKCDELDVKGFETRRSDIPVIAKGFLKVLFGMVCDGVGQVEIEQFVAEFRKKLRAASIPDLGFPVSIKSLSSYKSEPMHVRAMKYSLANGLIEENSVGGKIKYIFVTGVPERCSPTTATGKKVDVVAFAEDLPEGFTIDYKRIEERVVDMKVQPILDRLFGIGTEELF